MKSFVCLLATAAFVFSSMPAVLSQSAERYDLVIKNARIVDGTGNPWFWGSIAIEDGRIAKVGRFDAPNSKETIDAKGQIVAPGFIDVHAHTEERQ